MIKLKVRLEYGENETVEGYVENYHSRDYEVLATVYIPALSSMCIASLRELTPIGYVQEEDLCRK